LLIPHPLKLLLSLSFLLLLLCDEEEDDDVINDSCFCCFVGADKYSLSLSLPTISSISSSSYWIKILLCLLLLHRLKY